MARDWAREKVERVRKAGGEVHYLSWVLYERDALKLLKAERARARRVVRQYIMKTGWQRAALTDLLRRLQ